MALRDFFKTVRAKKHSQQNSNSANSILSDEEIAANWIKCPSCKATVYKADYVQNMNICPSCGHHGRLNLRERLDLIFDKNSLKEIDSDLKAKDPLKFNDGKPYPEIITKAQQKTGYEEAIITGFAKIKGIDLAVAVMNFEFLGGSMGSVVGEKFTRLIEKAISKNFPVLCISASGGARMHEGILSLMQMAKTSVALAKLEEAGLLYISLLTDPTYGGVSASFATLGDLIIAEPGSRIGFAGRRVIEETVREKLPEDFQTAEYLLEHGQIDMIIDRRELKDELANILKFHNYMSDEVIIPDTTANIDSQKLAQQPKKEIALDFEKPLLKIQEEIKYLEKKSADNSEDAKLIAKLKSQYDIVAANLYQSLLPIDITKIARHPNRPNVEDILNSICPGRWMEFHGDRAGTDDQAILTGLAQIGGQSVVVIGTRKGRSIKENQERNFGMPQPEGYRKAKRFFEYANKFKLPIITFIDTPGAYPGLNAEANGQSIAIAENLKSLATLKVPVIALVTGEGGSGGALAIGLANRVLMMENSIYSVISPEGCAAILWRTRDKAAEAAEALKLTAKDLLKFKIVDQIIPEPLGGAHKNWDSSTKNIHEALARNLKDLKNKNPEDLLEERRQKFYSYGEFLEPKEVKIA